jgi:Mg-chelatase subunit ChlD
LGLIVIPVVYENAHLVSQGLINIEKVSKSMISEEIQTLKFRIIDRASLATNTLQASTNNVKLLRDYATDLYNAKLDLSKATSYPLYNGETITPPSGLIQDPLRNREYSLKTGGYFLKTGVPNDVHVSNMDNIFRSIYLSNTYENVYIGKEEDGLFFSYPFTDLSGFRTFSYKCEPSKVQTIGYDPRCRPWYAFAKTSTEEVYKSAPYTDASTGALLITFSAKVNNESTNSLLGVVAIDITLTDLRDKILKSKVLENGYTYIMDEDKNAVIYPNLSYDKLYKVIDLEGLELSGDINAFDKILDTIVSSAQTSGSNTFSAQSSDTIEYMKNGQKWWISYSPVLDTPYYTIITVPNSDIEAPSKILSNIMLIILIVLMVSFGVLFLGVMLAIMVTCIPYNIYLKNNLESYTKILKQMKNGDLSNIEDLSGMAKELSEISDNIKKLLIVVKYGNQSYYQGNVQKARENYMEALKLMTETNNKRGIGSCLNNLGATYLQEKDCVSARAYYNQAIKNAQELVSETSDSETLETYKIALANRMMNLGIVAKEERKYIEAEQLYKQSMTMHRENGNSIGVAKVAGNLSQLYIDQQRIDEARLLVEESEAIIKQCGVTDLTSIQYSTLNKANVLYAYGNYGVAIETITGILQSAPELEHFIMRSSLTKLLDCFEKTGDVESANIIRNKTEGLISSTSAEPKEVIFVLDVSGSMAGTRIATCKDSIIKIFNDNILDDDLVSYLTFHSTVQTVFQNYTKQQHHNHMIDYVTQTRVQGRTAFYDAVYEAVNMCHQTSKKSYVIALTDGGDNESQRGRAQHVIQKVKNAQNTNLIMITVGTSMDMSTIGQILDANKKSGDLSMHIPATDVQSISSAFNKVGQVLASQINIEQL